MRKESFQRRGNLLSSTQQFKEFPSLYLSDLEPTLPQKGLVQTQYEWVIAEKPREARAGALIQDRNGNWVTGSYRHIPRSTNVEAELRALKNGLQLAII